MEHNPNTSLFQLNLDANNGYTLRSAASWGKVLGVVGIILSILFFVIAVLFQSAMSQTGGRYYDEDFGGGNVIGQMGMIVYILVGIVYLISSLFALNFGNKVSKALKTNDQQALNSGFAAARNLFAFWAILMIIGLLLMIISVASMATRGV